MDLLISWQRFARRYQSAKKWGTGTFWWAVCHLGLYILERKQPDRAALRNPERAEDYCEGSEAMENVEHFQRVEKVRLLTTALLRGSVGTYGTMSLLAENISVIPRMASTVSISRVVSVG